MWTCSLHTLLEKIDSMKKVWQVLQTVAIALLLVTILIPYPSNFSSYVMGVSMGISLVYGLGFSRKINRAFGFALPYWVLYMTFFISCLFADNFSNSFALYGHYFSLFLIPFFFVGMSPDFFTLKRLRIFGFALVVGVAVGMLWKVGTLMYIYRHNPILMVYREQGIGVGLRHFYKFYPYFTHVRYLRNPATESLFCNAALVLTLISWVKKDVFFDNVCRKGVAGVFIAVIMLNMLLFCTKTAAVGCLLSVFAVWVYALCKKRFAFVGVWVVIGVLMAGSLTFLRGSSIFSRFETLTRTVVSFCNSDTRIENDGSFLPRIYGYKQGWELFKERPITGWGLEYRKEFFKKYSQQYSDRLLRREGITQMLTHPHNQTLAIMDMAGLIGLLALVWVGFTVLRDVWRRKSLFWWIWFVGLLVFCTIEVLFNHIIGFIYLCGFHGVLFCELTSDFLHLEDADKPLVPEKSSEGI